MNSENLYVNLGIMLLGIVLILGHFTMDTHSETVRLREVNDSLQQELIVKQDLLQRCIVNNKIE